MRNSVKSSQHRDVCPPSKILKDNRSSVLPRVAQ